MKKVSHFAKKVASWFYKNLLNILLSVSIAGLLIAVYEWLHKIATEMRGYEAIGGEVFVPFLPLIIYYLIKSAND